MVYRHKNKNTNKMSNRVKTNKYFVGNCVYIISCESLGDLYKIGITKNLNQRLKAYHTSLPDEVKVHYQRRVTPMGLVEKIIHYNLKRYRVNDSKEWFRAPQLKTLIDEVQAIIDFMISRNPESVTEEDTISSSSEYDTCEDESDKDEEKKDNDFYWLQKEKPNNFISDLKRMSDMGIAKRCKICNLLLNKNAFDKRCRICKLCKVIKKGK
jgi:predicted GIY-YIG superfamily endonuclease